MALDSKQSEPERSLKRVREVDGSDVESTPTSKRHRLPTPSPSDHRLDEPLASPSLVPEHPQPASSLKRSWEIVDDSACAPASKRPIYSWLQTGHLYGATSAPPQLTGERTPATAAEDDYQCPLFDSLHEVPQSPSLNMSQPQGQSFDGKSVSSTQSSKLTTSKAMYRGILRNNGIRIDHTGEKIPEDLRKFVDMDILKERGSKLSVEDLAATVDTAVNIADNAKGNIYDLIGTAMFPIKRHDIGRGGNTLWTTGALPKSTQYSYSLATPKPDIHIGYLTDMQSTWRVSENAVVDHRAAVPYTRPARGNCFPFIAYELKSEAAGGTLWQAENQAAGSGSHCVNSMRWFFREAYPSKRLSLLDTVAFTVVATHREAVYHVHFYSEEEQTFHMSYIGAFSTVSHADIQRSNDITKNILEHGLGTRQKKIRAALGDMGPCLERWKQSRPASVLDSPACGPPDLPAEGQGPSKSVRLA